MVLKLQFRHWVGLQALTAILVAAQPAFSSAGGEKFSEAQVLYQNGQYFKAARYAFAAGEEDSNLRPQAYAWITLGLVQAGLEQSSTYFFIKTLQSGNKAAIRKVLTETDRLFMAIGPDLLRKYLVRHTTYEDYDSRNRSSYLYALGKDALLNSEEKRAIGYLNGVNPDSLTWGFSLQLRGTAKAIVGDNEGAIADFRACATRAEKMYDAAMDAGQSGKRDPARAKSQAREADDLKNRCLAGEARVYYQMNKFVEADRAYDRIPKKSIVWTDMLFEQAWNSFGRQEYNRSLGKLVSYKAPALQFVFNTEVDVLRAQSFLALCLYDDVNQVINEFNEKYAGVGEQVKQFVEANANNLNAFYAKGREAANARLRDSRPFFKMMNRFVRSPYFQNMLAAEQEVLAEQKMIRRFDSTQPGVSHEPGVGFPGFLNMVLNWRLKTIHQLGGAFVKNSLMDYHSVLISDFEKMNFIKLEMISRAKERLIYKRPAAAERGRGSQEPSRRDDQYYWSFNGEFWNDELGDYVFGLESECHS